MRRSVFALLALTMPLLSACQSPPSTNYTSADANEDAALNAIRDEDNEAAGEGVAVSGLIPDENGQLPMANVQ
ncbi:hypothetical protein [Sphingomonas oryzagri]|jgi:hypothetical protein|uniref:Uncharacterized protein n=1 Tax=Sphingomonas oryzagri TaxID=3042314 RepID=A0ABT6MZW9_9SPHN|nr:hypothetical protein [Sphingomonas oryzagri]MDH7638604.1 hypothetical protein [Sphingomonas oryzagri]